MRSPSAALLSCVWPQAREQGHIAPVESRVRRPTDDCHVAGEQNTRSVRSRCLRQWQREPERRAVAGDALDAHPSVVILNDGARDMQTKAETRARSALLFDARHAMEAIPDVCLLIHRQPWPIVLNGDARLSPAGGHGDTRGGIWQRVFERIGQEIGY